MFGIWSPCSKCRGHPKAGCRRSAETGMPKRTLLNQHSPRLLLTTAYSNRSRSEDQLLLLHSEEYHWPRQFLTGSDNTSRPSVLSFDNVGFSGPKPNYTSILYKQEIRNPLQILGDIVLEFQWRLQYLGPKRYTIDHAPRFKTASESRMPCLVRMPLQPKRSTSDETQSLVKDSLRR